MKLGLKVLCVVHFKGTLYSERPLKYGVILYIDITTYMEKDTEKSDSRSGVKKRITILHEPVAGFCCE
jgi:hypothetical protein